MAVSGYNLLRARPVFPRLAVLEGFITTAAQILHGPSSPCLLERADGKLKTSDSHLNPFVLRVKVVMPDGVKNVKFTLGITDNDAKRGRVLGNDHAYIQAPEASVQRSRALAELALDLWEDGYLSERSPPPDEQPKAAQPKARLPPPCSCCGHSSCQRIQSLRELPSDAGAEDVMVYAGSEWGLWGGVWWAHSAEGHWQSWVAGAANGAA